MKRPPEGDANVTRSARNRRRTEQKATGRHRRRSFRRGARWAAIAVVAAAAVAGLAYSITTAKRLPPTSMADHSEALPPDRILTTPIPLPIQKHVLEHAGGRGRPGVVINYNCDKFRCPEGTVARLERVARASPDFVYLAPYPDMDVKIAVTRLGEIVVLDDVDERRITDFIARAAQ